MISKQETSSSYLKITVTPRFCYFRSKTDSGSSNGMEISYGLSRRKKFINPKFFYDKTGSALFEKICSQPEYYLTRIEMKILDAIASELPRFLVGDYALVELGSGSSTKTRKLLQAISENQTELEYYPIDISEILRDSSTRLHDDFDNLKITGIIDQYEPALEFVKSIHHLNKIIAFLGSSLGNFEPEAASKFLTRIRNCMRKGDLLLLGLDLIKDEKILKRAYNDSNGITARFNLNLLSRINREHDADFDLEKFEHYATYNKKFNRIEMYLRSKIKQNVNISDLDLVLKFRKGELIQTEYSYKYNFRRIHQMAKKNGLRLLKMWTDSDNQFALALFTSSL